MADEEEYGHSLNKLTLTLITLGLHTVYVLKSCYIHERIPRTYTLNRKLYILLSKLVKISVCSLKRVVLIVVKLFIYKHVMN